METISEEGNRLKIVIIDCFAGISGDMTLGALIDSGVPLEFLQAELSKLKLDGWELEVSKSERHHIQATQVNVKFDVSQQTTRYFTDILKMINSSTLRAAIKEKAKAAFTALGNAEAKIHGLPIEKIHFHEIGAIDSIIDLIGSIIGMDFYKPEKIYHLPVPLGSGFTKTEHGVMPVPSPAAVEVLKEIPVEHRSSGYEMTTPTGATLIKVLTSGLLPPGLVYQTEKTGYGAGSKHYDDWPNVLRVIIAESAQTESELIMLETNIDDMNPELYSYVFQRLFECGARDVFLTQVIMKKGRPGVLLSVLTDAKNQRRLENELFLQTTTLGIRRYPVSRRELDRSTKKIKTEFGMVEVKSVIIDGKEILRPEFEVCQRLAESHQLSLPEVYRRIEKYNQE